VSYYFDFEYLQQSLIQIISLKKRQQPKPVYSLFGTTKISSIVFVEAIILNSNILNVFY